MIPLPSTRQGTSTGVGREVVDQAVVEHISSDLIRFIGDDCFHNIGSVFQGTGVRDGAILQDDFPFPDSIPSICLMQRRGYSSNGI